MKPKILAALVAGLVFLTGIPQAGAEEKLVPGKDRIDVPAIGNGLCLHNLFQSGMVLQRDKPTRIWGWAEAGEKVTVTFGEKTQSSTAAADRSWKVELPALPASSEPRTNYETKTKHAARNSNYVIFVFVSSRPLADGRAGHDYPGAR